MTISKNQKTRVSRVNPPCADRLSDAETVEDGNEVSEAQSIDPDTSGVSAEAVPVYGAVNDQNASVTGGGFTGVNALSGPERAKLLDDLNARHQSNEMACLGGDEETFLLRLNTAKAFHQLGGRDCPELVARAKKHGAKDAPRKGQSVEHWLAPGLSGVNINGLQDDERKRVSGRMTALAEVMIAAEWKAKAIGGITSPDVTADRLADEFTKPRQQAVHRARQDMLKGQQAIAASAVTNGDVESDEKIVDLADTLKALKNYPDLGKVHLRLDRPSELYAVVCYRDEEGDHIVAQIDLDPETLKAAVSRPNLGKLDPRLNAISEHCLLTKQLILPRASEVPEIADDPQSRMLPACRASLVHYDRMDTSINMVGSPEMIVVSRLNDDAFGDDHYVVNANSRNAFEMKVAEPIARGAYTWDGLGDGEVHFKNGKKVVPLKLVPANEWGSSKHMAVWAHRLGNFVGAANVCVSPDEVRRIEAEYLCLRDSRKDLSVEVSLTAAGVSFKLGKAKAMTFSGVLKGGTSKSQTVKVPARELALVLELAIGRATDRKLIFDADPAGVLEVRYASHGASHSVYLAKVTDTGARENGCVFQRYTKADFAPADQQEAA